MGKKVVFVLIIILAATVALYLWAQVKDLENKGNEAPSFSHNLSPMEVAVGNYLLAQKQFSWKTAENSQNFCMVEKLDSEKELFPLYFWAYCGEYVLKNGELKTLSGSSGPVKIDYPNELSFYDLSRFSYEAPGDGSHYAEDVKKIFPEDLWQEIFNFDRKNIISRAENFALGAISGWERIKQAIENCEAKSVFQAHSLAVGAELKNGEKLSGMEPKIDDIIDLAVSAEAKCGKIQMATE